MGAVNTPTGHQMRANCGKACNHHTLHWLVEPLQGCNRQIVQIFSFHPRSAGGVAGVTWRLAVLSRMLFPSFSLVLHSNSARWDWPSRVDLELSGIGFGSLPSFLLFFVHPSIRYTFHKLPLKELHVYIWLFYCNYSRMTVFLLCGSRNCFERQDCKAWKLGKPLCALGVVTWTRQSRNLLHLSGLFAQMGVNLTNSLRIKLGKPGKTWLFWITQAKVGRKLEAWKISLYKPLGKGAWAAARGILPVACCVKVHPPPSTPARRHSQLASLLHGALLNSSQTPFHTAWTIGLMNVN